MIYRTTPFPPVSKSPTDILKLFGPASAKLQELAGSILGARRNYLGCDLEFDEQERPTILGVSDGALNVSVPYAQGIEFFRELVTKHNPVFVGHFFTSADLFSFRTAGIDIDVLNVQDTAAWHYLTSMHLCKTTKKGKDGDGEKRGRGYMNLWTFISLWTSLPSWKDHRADSDDEDCGGPCPLCHVFDYNGIDALGPLLALPEVVKTARLRGVAKLYPMHNHLSYVLAEMHHYGTQGDRAYVNELREELERDKKEIADQLPFNPESWQQILKHFREQKKIKLEATDEDTIRETIEKGEDDPELHLLLEYKELGDGADRWFAPQTRNKSGELEGYMDERDRVYPRLGMFTSSGRLQCSSPNLHSVPKRRVDRHTCTCTHKDVAHSAEGVCRECPCSTFKPINVGKKIRRALIASPGTYLLKGDYCLAPGTRLLDSSFQWRPIESFNVGDTLFAFDEELGTYNTRTKLSTVETVTKIKLPCYRITTDKGSLIASEGHLFASRQWVKGKWRTYVWTRTDNLKVGDTIGYFGQPWPGKEDSFDAGYISGILDGEGFTAGGSKRSVNTIAFAQAKGPVLDNALRILKERGIEFRTYEHASRLKKNPHWKPLVTVYFTGTNRPGMKALARFGSVRLLEKAQQLWVGKRVWNSHNGKSTITAIDYVGEREVIGMQTSSRTMIAEGFLSHNSNAENRVFLHLAGIKVDRDRDLHSWVAEIAKLTPEMEFCLRLGGPREAAKSIQHAGNYLEGLQLKKPSELLTERIRQEVNKGARIVYPKWTFNGKIVTFTGANLAQRAFGSKSFENRRKALEIAERYFGNFPAVRALQQDITKRLEREKATITPLGYYTLALGDDEEIMKTACAIWGSQPVSHYTKLSLIDLWQKFRAGSGIRPILQVHDEEMVEVDQSIAPDVAAGHLAGSMEIEVPEIPGLALPTDLAYSPWENGRVSNWRDTVAIKT